MIEAGMEYWSRHPEESPGQEALAARDFIKELRNSKSPDLNAYAKGDIDNNPIAVLWAQFFQRQQGLQNKLIIPPYFQDIFLFSVLDQHLKNAHDHDGVSRMILNLVRDFKKEHFHQNYYDIREHEFRTLWDTILPTHVMRLYDVDPDFTEAFLKETLLLQNDLSSWFWDREFARQLVTEYAKPAFTNALYKNVIRSNAEGKTIKELRPREFEEVTFLYAASLFRVHLLNEGLRPVYEDLCAEMVERFQQGTQSVLEALLARAAGASRDEDWIRQTLDQMEPSLRGTLIEWLDIRQDTLHFAENHVRPDEIEIGRGTLQAYKALKASAEGETQELKEALLTKPYAMNYHLIREIQNIPEIQTDRDYWDSWRREIDHQILIRNYYERAIGYLASDNLCPSFEVRDDRFIRLLTLIKSVRFHLQPTR